MQWNANNIATVRLDHLGIVAGICEELKIEERIDALIEGRDPRRVVT